MTAPVLTLANGVGLPQLGFGTYRVPPGDTAKVVQTALEAGYRHIDTASVYRNEAAVGQAVRESGLPREELFVTTKLWNTDQGYDRTLRAFDTSMAELGLDYVDLYLIHWPAAKRAAYIDSWRALATLYRDGRVRAIGVSNFQISHLRRLSEAAGLVPAVNQVELHPFLTQPELRAYHAEHGIATVAWSPLAQGAVLGDPVITTLAQKYGKSPAQIVLRWHLQLGTVAIPKSVAPERIRANLDVFDFELAGDDVLAVTDLDAGHRTGPDPDVFDAA